MGVIYPSRHRPAKQPRKLYRYARVVALCLGIFIAINLLIAGYYHARTYPRTSVAGVNVGNVQYGQIEQKAAQLHLLPETITLQYRGKKATVNLGDLGISSNTARTKASLKHSRSWLPIVSLFTKHTLDAPAGVNDIKLQQKAEALIPTFHEAPTDASITLENTRFTAVPGKDGYDLSIARLKHALLDGLDKGSAAIDAPISSKAPKFTTAAATSEASQLQKQLDTPFTYQADGKSVTLRPQDVATWFTRSGSSYALNDSAIRTSIASAAIKAGIRASNLSDAVLRSKQALNNQKALTFALVPFAVTKTYHYCTALKGVDASNLSVLQTQLKQTYNDTRGWMLDGQLILLPVGEGVDCDFTVWLTRADLMPTFGEICDAEWSCRIGPNVVINFTRWQETSPAWKQSGGSLEDYRHMVINHETGHWFGFDHSVCPGTGQAAPVMMQQSISLGGCTFNPWPTQRELEVLKRSLDLP